MELTYKIVQRLLRDDEVEFSRNKNFEAYEDPRVKRAVRIYRHLESVEQDLLQTERSGRADLDIVERDGRTLVQLAFPRKGGRRLSYLEPEEWVLMTMNPNVEHILDGLLERVDPDVRRTLNSFELEQQ